MRRSLLVTVGLLGANVLVLAGISNAGATEPAPAPDPAKLDSSLRVLLADSAAGHRAPAAASTVSQASGAQLNADGEVLVDVYVDGSLSQTRGDLSGVGMDVEATSSTAAQPMVEGWVPVGALLDATAIPGARAIVVVPAGYTNEGATLSQGDAAHHGPAARALGATGAGVKVGIISDSINRAGGGVAGSQATGDLPGPASSPAGAVHVLLDGSAGSPDEGRAMSEIVYDTAPGVRDLYFTTGQGAATRAAGINNLVSNGVKVIADDTFQITEPFFQDGVVAQAIDAAKAAGVSYLVSAGNRARQSWESSYAPTTDPRAVSGSTMDFDPGAATDAVQTVGTFSSRPNMFIELQWAEPYGHSTSDFAVDVYDNGTYAFTADTDNVATGIPGEFVGISVPSGSHSLGIAIRRVSGTGNPLLKYIVGGTQTFSIVEHPTGSEAIDPDGSSAKGALTVAASQYTTPASPESFSSRGPSVTKLFSPTGAPLATPDVRTKPNLAAADGVSTTLPLNGGLNPFFGTSAAAPHAAAIAALVRSANPALNVDQVAAILTDPALATDCTASAGQPDADCGSGFILADKMVAAAKDTSPPTVSLTPAAPKGGWFGKPVPVSWVLTDAQSPILSQTGCAPTTVTATATLTCTAASVGGATTTSVQVKIDRTAPTKLKAKGLKKNYAHGATPVKKQIKCQAKDGESGVASCKIKGLKTSPGKHTVTVVATNKAGLVSKKKFSYTIS